MNTKRRALIAGLSLFAAFLAAGCGASKIEPVEIYPEDNCAQCRMAISEHQFASEIIDRDGEVYKFDDLACMLKFRSKHSDLKVNVIFLKDYETKEWIPYERATIVETSIETPMGSGKVAFADAARAKTVQQRYPAENAGHNCSGACCD